MARKVGTARRAGEVEPERDTARARKREEPRDARTTRAKGKRATARGSKRVRSTTGTPERANDAARRRSRVVPTAGPRGASANRVSREHAGARRRRGAAQGRRPRSGSRQVDAGPSRRARGVGVARAPAVPPVTARDVDPVRLHPAFRSRVTRVLAQLAAEGIPFRIFEAYRSPQRQRWLWDQGRSRPGAIVTKAQPWESYHQYGLASDLVLHVDGQWSWDTAGPRAAWWKRMQEIGRANGLEALSFELPHLQLAGTSIAQLRAGTYPAGGDESWANGLAGAIYAWQGAPAAPAAPVQVAERPPLPVEALVAAPVAAPPGGTASSAAATPGAVPVVAASDWHARFNGRRWRVDANGVYTKELGGGTAPMRTDGEPVTMRRIWALFGSAILAASRRHALPPALIMMVIATETAAYRNYGFTGPFTFRWEPHVKVNDVTPNVFGDYSVGPMQILATTARWVIAAQRLDYDAFRTAPVFERRPEPPQALPLYDPAANIDVGCAVMKQRWAQSGDDPVLVAAAYNAGGVYASEDNPWRIRCYGNHLDRAAQWYGDACFVLREAGIAPRVRAFQGAGRRRLRDAAKRSRARTPALAPEVAAMPPGLVDGLATPRARRPAKRSRGGNGAQVRGGVARRR